jgi:hypothetical protein
MAKDLDDIYKKIDQSHKELCKQDSEISKNITSLDKDNEKIIKDIADIKKEVKNIALKVDTMLEILNSFTLMLAEDDEDLEENYDLEDSDESWVPKEDDFWNDDNDDESI